MSTGQQAPKRQGRSSNSRQGQRPGAENAASVSSVAAAPSSDTAPQCGWLGQVFGQCCEGPAVEPEVRIPEVNQRAQGSSRYLIDNNILHNANSPGIAYRYSKILTDKVRNEETEPAKWGEVVEGIDEGDGWLRVGRYYLPMTHQDITAITLIQDGGAGQAAMRQGDRYLIDNSVLQSNSPGVAYRYKKVVADKVKNEMPPAKWGEIIHGIDEGDGWLKVGKYYLPMTHQGMPAITAVQDAAASQSKGKRRAERYMIDNTVLQIANRPGLAYRYTKTEGDKVKNEIGPAKWCEIVEGVDEGDGWLKVGKYYLPMQYRGTAVITPAQDSQTKPKRRVEGSLNLTAPAELASSAPAPAQAPASAPALASPAPAPAPTVAQASATPPASAPRALPTETSNDAAPLRCEGAASPSKQFVEKRGISPKLPPSMERTPLQSTDSGSPSLQQQEQKLVQQQREQKQQEPLLQRQPWFLRPSVGAWVHPGFKWGEAPKEMPTKMLEMCQDSNEFAPHWYHKASVGTWLKGAPRPSREMLHKASHMDLLIQECGKDQLAILAEEKCGKDHLADVSSASVDKAEHVGKQETPKGETFADISPDEKPFTPSTCGLESQNYTPLSTAAQ